MSFQEGGRRKSAHGHRKCGDNWGNAKKGSRDAEARKDKGTESPLEPQKEPVLQMHWLELSETNFGHLASTTARVQVGIILSL